MKRCRALARIGLLALVGRRARIVCAIAAVLAAPAGPAAAAPFEDTIAQRVLACTGCHGREGRAAADGYYPRIAGKPEGYLFNQLRHFRDGRRHYELMRNLLALLDDAYLREIAAYFASLDLPYPAPAPLAGAAALRATGEALVRRGDAARGLPACDSCHGTAMTGRAPFVPGLLGLPRDYLNAQLGAWQTGSRHAAEPDCMAQIARRLNGDDVGAISAWLAAQPVPAHAAASSEPIGTWPMACGSIDDKPSANAPAPR